jgi:hypothetical protein
VIADPTAEEEAQLSSTLTVAVGAEGEVAGVLQGGAAPWEPARLAECVAAAQARARVAREAIEVGLRGAAAPLGAAVAKTRAAPRRGAAAEAEARGGDEGGAEDDANGPPRRAQAAAAAAAAAASARGATRRRGRR